MDTMHHTLPEMTLSTTGGDRQSLKISLQGRLQASNAAEAAAVVDGIVKNTTTEKLIIDCADLQFIDDFGIAVLTVVRRNLKKGQVAFALENIPENIRQTLAVYQFSANALPPLNPIKPAGSFLVRTGAMTVAYCHDLAAMIRFLGATILALLRFAVSPRSLRWQDTLHYMQTTGVDALPIVLTISFLLGLIMAFMSSVQLQQFGANIYVASLVSLSMTRELGPIMTAIIVAGRSGSAYAAEIGSMKISEEIDALTTMGFDAHLFLVLPKIIAACLVVPMLTLFSDLAAIAGGLLVGIGMLDLTMNGYITQTVHTLELFDVFWGVFKSVIFALLISWTGCLRGFQVTGGAAGVGQATTSAVVSSIFLIILADSLLVVVLRYWQ